MQEADNQILSSDRVKGVEGAQRDDSSQDRHLTNFIASQNQDDDDGEWICNKLLTRIKPPIYSKQKKANSSLYVNIN